MVNTGARPSELVGLRPEDLRLDAAIPHIRIAPYPGRALKSRRSERDLPVIGAAAEGARLLAAMGGPDRYRLRPTNWSGAVNKYLSENGLKPSEAVTPYSLRHGFEDRLLAAGVDGRVRADLMGHAYDRPAYGAGAALEMRTEAIGQIALQEVMIGRSYTCVTH